MSRMITNYEKHKEKILQLIADMPPSVGCIYQELTGGDCIDCHCEQCAKLLASFLQEETEHPLSEKELMFCRIVESGAVERRTNNNLAFLKDKGNGYMAAYDITGLGIFEWLEVTDGRFSIEEYLKNYE